MNFLAVIPMPINFGGGGLDFGVSWTFSLVLFVAIIIPCIVYSLWYYIKCRREYPAFDFHLSDIPTPPLIICSVYILLNIIIGLVQITYWLYGIIF